jgi:hypothetical protein
VEHPGLLPGLTIDEIVLDTGGIEQEQAVGTEQNCTNGDNEFCLKFHGTDS